MRKVINLGTSYLNTYLVEIEGGWMLVDTGYPFGYKRFIKKAARKGVALSSIRYVVLTHVHADHAGFLKKILADTGATLVCLPAERERLLSGVNEKNVYLSRKGLFLINRISASLPRFQTFEPVDISGSLDAETQPLAEEGITFFVLHGHTDNDLCFRVDDKLFVGDLCMNGAGATGYSPLWIEDNAALVESWREILATDAAYLYVGHGKPFKKGELEKYVEKQSRRTLCKLFK
ncbi:MAG: MBL fold metallo-hydrolase [Clostridia bacterium]|nr:MBL fold metallo-hydrolase [Clostridia bacterium]